LSQPIIANIHGLKEVKEGGEVEVEEIWNMEEGNQQDSLLRVNREVGDPPSPVLTVLPPFFSPNPYLQLDQSLLRTPCLLPRSEAPEILV
jgi:hypothetical protein